MDEFIKENAEISDMDSLVRKGLYKDNDYTDKFYKLYKRYHILLDKYLVHKFSLDKYDRAFDEAKLRFIPINKKDMDYYQYISQMGLNYLYLRNNIYVEKLPNDDINKVLSLNDNSLEYPSEELFELIERTYRDIIDVSTEPNDVYMCRYGPDNDNYWFPSNELIIGFRHDDFADNGLGEGEEWSDNNTKQIIFINNFLENIHNSTAKLTEEDVNFVWYNDYSIKEPVLSK